MSAASSVRCAVSASVLSTPVFAAAPRASTACSDAIARTWPFGDAVRQPHHAIDQHALLGAPHLRLVRRRRRRVEGRRRQPIDDFLEAGQRRIDRVLRHHARRAIELQHEADRHVGGDRRRAQRIEGVAGRPREQLAVHARSPAAAAGSDRAPASAPSARTASASPPARRAPCADRRPTRPWSACGRRRASRRCSPARRPSTPPTSTA